MQWPLTSEQRPPSAKKAARPHDEKVSYDNGAQVRGESEAGKPGGVKGGPGAESWSPGGFPSHEMRSLPFTCERTSERRRPEGLASPGAREVEMAEGSGPVAVGSDGAGKSRVRGKGKEREGNR
ncbi:MAG: hypothetical protein HY694_00955 [Deltaproteobacteria bacterium]|nr:hypothetical protein [Deltaproteobacteria bacterium]